MSQAAKTEASVLKFWPIFFLLTFVEGVIALMGMAWIPTDAQGMFGFSPFRLVMLAGLLVGLIVLAWLSFLSWRSASWRESWLNPRRRPRLCRTSIIASLVLSLGAGLGLFLLRYYDPEWLMPYFVRARPLLIYLLAFGAQLALWLLFLRQGLHGQTLRQRKDIYRAALIVMAVLLSLWALVALTGLGLTPDASYWAEPGVPLQGWQVALAVLIGGLILLLGLCISLDRSRRATRRVDALIAVALWGLAVAAWMSVPLSVLQNSFYAPIQPPYDQPFPYSDAGNYDYEAQSLLLGNGFIPSGLVGAVPPRPLYIVFLTGLHALLGNSYASLVLGQTLLLALFPVALFFLGKALHSRATGVLVALLAIFRELTTLWLSSDIRVANSKMLLSDFPTALALSLYILLALRWYRARKPRLFLPYLAGGVFGLMLLLRSQSLFLLPFVLLLALPALWPDWKRWMISAALFCLGAALGIAPWLLRNWQVTGQPSFDDPLQAALVASLYSGGTPSTYLDKFADMTSGEIGGYIMQIVLQKPGYVAGFVSNHFAANEIDTLLVLPLIARFDGLFAPINAYWVSWNGALTWYNLLLLVVYLALIAVGVGAAWKRLRWAGLLPLVFNLGYAFSAGLVRISGWRYILPVDWVGYLYFGIGVMELLGGLALLFGAEPVRVFPPVSDEETASPPLGRVHPRKVVAASGLFLLVGSLPWLLEKTIPSHLESLCEDTPAACALNLASVRASGVTAGQLEAFAAQPEAVAVSGRLLYPRYFSPGAGLGSTNPWPAYDVRAFPRMGFVVLYPQSLMQAVFPTKGIPAPFPNGEDVIVFGCDRGRYVEVMRISFIASDVTYVNDHITADCALK